MNNENENMQTQQKKKLKTLIATGFEPLSPIWGCSFGYSVPHIVQ